ncbi:MAG TPA: DNA polymerase III subunit delta, partial [Parachlamydiaceae bacterium]|nr:DNA polymerase III subunit delta [Parachlamydiaceae bacterium]
MKYSSLTVFEKHLESAAPSHFAEIYLILAKEPFMRKQATDTLTTIVLKDEASAGLSLHLFDAERHGVENILNELKSISFFSKKRVIVIQNVDSFDKAATLKLEAYCAQPNRSVCLVLSAVTLNRATTFYKKLEKLGIVLDVPEEKPWEKEKSIADWLHREAIKQGKQLNPNVCQMVIKQLGTDQMLLSAELSKLICYVGDRKSITENDIMAISSITNLENGWQLGEAIFRRDASTALR